MNLSPLEDIVNAETKIKVVFNHKINNFGFLINDTTQDIEVGVKVDVPLYIAQFLLENKHCTLVNEILSEEIKNDLRANSSIINLNLLYTYFYYFISNFEDNDYVLNIMFSRYNCLFKLILKERLDEDDLYILDVSEKKVITTARKYFLLYRTFFIKS